MSGSNRFLEIHPLSQVGTATPLHDGTNAQNYPKHLEGFVAQALETTHFGQESLTGEANGFTVRRGEAVNFTGFLSRGSPFSYDLTRMYYIGGPWKLIIERQT